MKNGLLVILRMEGWRVMACGETKMGRSILANGRGTKRMDMEYILLVRVGIKVYSLLYRVFLQVCKTGGRVLTIQKWRYLQG